MENIYCPVPDNIAEIISIIQSFRYALSLSKSSKYLSYIIYHVPNMTYNKSVPLSIFKKFVHAKKLTYIQHADQNISHQLRNLIKLEDLKVHYVGFNIFQDMNFKILNRLTSLEMQFYSFAHWKNTSIEEITFCIETNNLQKLTLNYACHQKIKTIINCPNLIYFDWNRLGSRATQPFEINYFEMTHNLQDLILISVDFELDKWSFDKLTHLNVKIHQQDLNLNHLRNLILLSISDVCVNITIEKLRYLTYIYLNSCHRNIKIHDLPNLRRLKVYEKTKKLDIDSVNNLETVRLRSGHVGKFIRFKFCEMKHVKNLNINRLQYDSYSDKRILQLKQEKRIIQGECSLDELKCLDRLTHLVLINNHEITNVECLKHLRKLTKTFDGYSFDEIIVKQDVVVKHMTVDEALIRYAKYM